MYSLYILQITFSSGPLFQNVVRIVCQPWKRSDNADFPTGWERKRLNMIFLTRFGRDWNYKIR